ncbi:MAG TPA: hypothetical protein VGS60_05015 [Actinomycetes bacterium]|jgi:hypothetical protein|nr:hypothetical protein [Actinomycetes bacterium]
MGKSLRRPMELTRTAPPLSTAAAAPASGYQLGWQAFLSTLRRMLELGDGWRKIEQLT